MATPDQFHQQALKSTYLGEKSSASVLVDGFDRARLAKELATSIELERTRQKIDDTKKRAISTARDYNEFKNMVLMADQKRVTTKEMKEFGQAAMDAGYHRGREEKNNSQHFIRITGTGKPDTRQRTSRSAKRRKNKRAQAQNHEEEITSTNNLGAPTNDIEFARGWERFASTDPKKLAFLLSIDSKAIPKVLKRSLDFTLLGEILTLFHSVQESGGLDNKVPDLGEQEQDHTIGTKIVDFLLNFRKIKSFTNSVGLLGLEECEYGTKIATVLAKKFPAKGDGLAAVAELFKKAALAAAPILPDPETEKPTLDNINAGSDEDDSDDSDSEESSEETDSDDESS